MEHIGAITGRRPSHRLGTYQSWDLAPDRRTPFDMAWTSRITVADATPHHLLPFAEPSLAIRRRFSEDGATRSVEFVLLRASPDGCVYAPSAGEELFALRLCPELLETSLGLKCLDHQLEDTEVPRHLEDALCKARGLAAEERFVEAWSAMALGLRRLSDTDSVDRVAYAAALTRRSRGQMSPREIVDEAGISARHARREFLKRFGLTPRAWLRRQRLTAAITGADAQKAPSWAAIAADCGYADQSHLIRECRSITGKTPGQLHAIRNALAVSFNT